jgi:hypothetical protein
MNLIFMKIGFFSSQYLALGGVIGLPVPVPPYVNFCFFSAGFRI